MGQDGLSFPENEPQRGLVNRIPAWRYSWIFSGRTAGRRAAVLDAAEPIRQLGRALPGAELVFRVRIVVGTLKGRQRVLLKPPVNHHEWRAAWKSLPCRDRVDIELAGGPLLVTDGFLNELLGQCRAFPLATTQPGT
jgi:hypothetical protein